jgi:hypothetical protein
MVITILYRRLMPNVDILFAPDGRYIVKDGKMIRFRVDLISAGEWQERVSFRLESIREEGGDFLPIERRGLQREAGKGPMPLKEAKFGYVAEFDTSDRNGKIKILITADLAHEYVDDPIVIDASKSWLVTISLNPKIGQSCQRQFRIWVDEQNELRMEEV